MVLSPRERKAALVIRGLSHKEIALTMGVSRPLIGMVLTGRARNDRIERYIAQQIGRPISEVFPPRAPDGRKARKQATANAAAA